MKYCQHGSHPIQLQTRAAGFRFMNIATRFIASAVLSLVVSAAQVPSDPPTPTPGVVTDGQQEGSNQESNVANDETPVIPAPEPQNNTETENGDSGSENILSSLPQWLRDWWVVITAIVVFGGGVLRLYFYVSSYYAANSPKLRIENITFPQLGRFNRRTPFNEMEEAYQQGFVGCYFDLVNIGISEARLITGYTQFRITDKLRMQNSIGDGMRLQIKETRLAPGESRTINIPDIEQREPHLMSRFIDGEITAYLICDLKYTNRIRVMQRIRFCHKFNHAEQRFEPAKHPDYEQAD